ncbi:MAG TPA: type I glyceraldehyde-3-phosphate dehydrogenase [Thermoanaerobaculia bacterium]|nr:type I glyceraldehyde-3-phosphate dehydrogenase [Thermoanaerobaculia bacterium]
MTPVRIGINGFGRIGRTVFRIVHERPDVEVALVNDLYENEQLAYLLKYDTVMGVFPGEVGYDDQYLYANGRKVRMTAERDPAAIPWGTHGVDFVIESTGVWSRPADLEKHLAGGARKVVLTVPARDEIDAMIVIGVNEDILEPRHRLVSNASCTTNCLAPIAKILDDFFGIDSGLMTTVHAYTNDQRLADVPHKDLRRSRAAAENIIPTTTGAAKAVGKVLPRLAGKLDGLAMRVPVPDGSVVDLVCHLRSGPTSDEINHAVREAAASPRLHRIVQYTEEALVSTDIVGNSHSSIFDALSTDATGDGWAKVIAWYDNEWGYSNRVVDLLMLPAFQEIPATVEAAARRR